MINIWKEVDSLLLYSHRLFYLVHYNVVVVNDQTSSVGMGLFFCIHNAFKFDSEII